MSRASKVLTVLVVLVLGLWGCARGPANRSGQLEEARELKNKNARLEQEARKAGVARDQEREKALKSEDRATALQADLDALKQALDGERDKARQQGQKASSDRQDLLAQLQSRTNERDEARAALQQRLAERDALQAQCERIKKGLQALMDEQTTQAAPAGPTLASPGSPAAQGGQS